MPGRAGRKSPMIKEFLQASNGKYVRIVELNGGCNLYIRPDFAWYSSLLKRRIMFVGNGSTIILDGKYFINFRRENEIHDSH